MGEVRQRGDGCLASSTNFHQSELPSQQTDGDPDCMGLSKKRMGKSACVCRPVCLFLFPKEISSYNKHSHSFHPADLINKTRSSAYLKHAHTHKAFRECGVTLSYLLQKEEAESSTCSQ